MLGGNIINGLVGIENMGFAITITLIASRIRKLWSFSVKNGGHFEIQNGGHL